MTTVRLGTRGSDLAMAQTRSVADVLRARWPAVEVELVTVETSGDTHLAAPLGPELGSSFFTREIEEALLEGRIDAAVHSCKDLASAMPDGLLLAAVPERANPYDVLVSSAGRRLGDLPPGASVGTSSVRRQRYLERARPDLEMRALRGNVPTRLRSVTEGEVDAVVLAAAGLERLGMAHRIVQVLGPPLMLPAAGQGAIALQARADDAPVLELLVVTDHAPSHVAVTAERACLRRLGAGCQAPVGILARVHGTLLRLEAAVVTPEEIIHAVTSGGVGAAEEMGRRVASELLDRMGLPSLADVSWAGPPPQRKVPENEGVPHGAR